MQTYQELRAALVEAAGQEPMQPPSRPTKTGLSHMKWRFRPSEESFDLIQFCESRNIAHTVRNYHHSYPYCVVTVYMPQGLKTTATLTPNMVEMEKVINAILDIKKTYEPTGTDRANLIRLSKIIGFDADRIRYDVGSFHVSVIWRVPDPGPIVITELEKTCTSLNLQFYTHHYNRDGIRIRQIRVLFPREDYVVWRFHMKAKGYVLLKIWHLVPGDRHAVKHAPLGVLLDQIDEWRETAPKSVTYEFKKDRERVYGHPDITHRNRHFLEIRLFQDVNQ